MDDADAVSSTTSLCALATITARATYKLAAGAAFSEEVSESIGADCDLVSELFYCLTVDWNCSVTHSLGFRGIYPPPEHYVSVFKYMHSVTFTQKFLYLYAISRTHFPIEDQVCEEGASDFSSCAAGTGVCLDGNLSFET
tara:strand:+ start:211 stop:630 length:420 start_codon:yes stop_codon:yes gene_type:complete